MRQPWFHADLILSRCVPYSRRSGYGKKKPRQADFNIINDVFNAHKIKIDPKYSKPPHMFC